MANIDQEPILPSYRIVHHLNIGNPNTVGTAKIWKKAQEFRYTFCLFLFVPLSVSHPSCCKQVRILKCKVVTFSLALGCHSSTHGLRKRK